MEIAARTAESVARDHYGRLVAYLASRSHDLAGAEDALSEAFLAALESWPSRGVPNNPTAWLLTAARRKLIDAVRHESVRSRVESDLSRTFTEFVQTAAPETITDDRLRLMFVCAHPAIDPSSRTPLILQTILGLDAAVIASAFLVSPTSMSQRLVRAKSKIRDAGIPFDPPDGDEIPHRLDSVLEAIYAAFGTGWDHAAGSNPGDRGLTREAIRLGRMVDQLAPDQPEAKGLLALMLFCAARVPARRTHDGQYVPLDQQDVSLWLTELIDEAESILRDAAGYRQVGRFQLEAAIQSAHAQRRLTGSVPWVQIIQLYDALVEISPTIGCQVGRAAAIASAGRPGIALEALDAIDPRDVEAYQPYWSVRAHALAESQSVFESLAAYDRAIGLSNDQALRDFLLRRRSEVNPSH